MTSLKYIVTVHDVGNVTDKAENIHTILTSTDNIQPRERVNVVAMAQPLTGPAINPSYTGDLERTIRKVVRLREMDSGIHVIAMRPVKRYTGDRSWQWDGFILIESDGDEVEFDLNGNGVRASSAYEVPR